MRFANLRSLEDRRSCELLLADLPAVAFNHLPRLSSDSGNLSVRAARLVAGLLVTYLSALAGMAGYMDAATVAFLALCGATAAFIATVAYLTKAELERRRKR